MYRNICGGSSNSNKGIFSYILVLSAEILHVTYYNLFDHSLVVIFVLNTEMCCEIRYRVVQFEIVSRISVPREVGAAISRLVFDLFKRSKQRKLVLHAHGW